MGTKKKRLALTRDGIVTYCTASDEFVGKGRCNHIMHGDVNDPKGFAKLVEEHNKSPFVTFDLNQSFTEIEPGKAKYPLQVDTLEKFSTSIYENYSEEERNFFKSEFEYRCDGYNKDNGIQDLYIVPMHSFSTYLANRVRLFITEKYQENGIDSVMVKWHNGLTNEADPEVFLHYLNFNRESDASLDNTRYHLKLMNDHCNRLGFAPLFPISPGESPLDCDYEDIIQSFIEFSLDRSLYKDSDVQYKTKNQAPDEKIDKIFNTIKDNVLNQSIRKQRDRKSVV